MVSLTCTALLEIQKMAFEKERRELREAAEFEARVTAKLANYIETLGWKGCGKHALEQARLQVEKEMDTENG